MAPERIDADIYYLNCDIWSLGVIIMECVLGYYPYLIYNNFEPLNSVWNLHELIENNPVPPLDDKIYSKELIDFSKKCLIKNLKERPTATVLLKHPFIFAFLIGEIELMCSCIQYFCLMFIGCFVANKPNNQENISQTLSS